MNEADEAAQSGPRDQAKKHLLHQDCPQDHSEPALFGPAMQNETVHDDLRSCCVEGGASSAPRIASPNSDHRSNNMMTIYC